MALENTSQANSAASRPIRICWIIPTLDQGGAEKQLVTLAQSIDRERFDPYVITLTRSGHYLAELQASRIPVIEINKRGKFDPFALRRLRSSLQVINPDIVHTWIFAANAYGRYAALKNKVPIIFGGERCVDPWKSAYQLIIDRYLARHTTGILTNSSAIRDFYVRKGLPASSFTIVHNGIATARTSSIRRSEALSRLNLPENTKIVASVGRLWPQKGYKDLIWAAGMLNVVRPEYQYVIFGEGDLLHRLEQYRDDTGAVDAIKFAGHRNDMADLLPHVDLFWNGSLYEGQSNSIMEAMQAGVPVLASDIPGNRDLVVHDNCGFLYPIGAADQLLKLSTRLIEEPDLRERLTSNARAKIANDFSVEQMVRKHQEIYESAIRSVARN